MATCQRTREAGPVLADIALTTIPCHPTLHMHRLALAFILLLIAGCGVSAPNQPNPGLRLIDVKVHSTMTTCGSSAGCRAYALVAPADVDKGEAMLRNLSPTYPFYLIWVGKLTTTDYLVRFRLADLNGSGAISERTIARCAVRFDPREAPDAVMVHMYVVFEATACRVTGTLYTTTATDPSFAPSTP